MGKDGRGHARHLPKGEPLTAPPLVTVVTPSLNQGNYIRATIESVLSQDYPHLDYWVIDGRSTDNTRAILQSYSRHPNFHYCSEPDRGQAEAIQKGWQHGRGHILAWLNADDLYQPGAVSQIVAALAQRPQAVMVCGSAQVIDAAGRPFGRIAAPHLTLSDMLGLVHFLPQPAVFMRAEAVRAVGSLNTALHYAFDFDLFLRLAAQGSIHYIEKELALYRWHDEAKTAANFSHLRLEAAQVARTFLNSTAGQQMPDRRHLLSYSHLVEGYAHLRLGRVQPFLTHTMRGLSISPANIQWIVRRTVKHLRRNGEPALAYPYDPALS